MIDLALDLAAVTGVAIRYDTEQIACTTWNLSRGNLGGRRSPLPAVRLLERLERLSANHEIRRVAYEETFARGDAKFRLDSLQTVTCVWAIRNGISWMRFSPTNIKKEATGSGKACKLDMIAAAQRMFQQREAGFQRT